MTTYKNALVLGLGISGVGAAHLLLSRGCMVTVLDKANTPALKERAAGLIKDGARVLLGAAHIPSGAFDLAVVSPGLASNCDWLQELRKRGVPIVPELELGWSNSQGKVLAVTGSNGKSTMIKWWAETFLRLGAGGRIAGNYGHSLCEAVCEDPCAYPWLLEVSSFQLEATNNFRADVGVILNILPNHLDRHGTFAEYIAAKVKLFRYTKPDDVCIVPEEEAAMIRAVAGGEGRWLTFGCSPNADYRYKDGMIFRDGKAVASLAGTIFNNPVLGVNAAAGFAALEACGIPSEAACESAKNLKPLPHRLEYVGQSRGVKFVDDSKATNLSAMVAALQSVGGPVRLIAGGIAKEKDFTLAKEELVKWGRGVYIIGQAMEDMVEAWSEHVPCRRCADLGSALKSAWRDAQPGETILLSPACASFDQFTSFEHRGNCFQELVRKLTEES